MTEIDEAATSSTSTPPPPVRILIINPNTSQPMTNALKPVVQDLGIPGAQYTFFTSPTPGIPSINSPADAAQSADICLPHLLPLVAHHDCFLVACYSQHPLVARLKAECAAVAAAATQGPEGSGARKYVTGIFEASVLASLALLRDSPPGKTSGTAAATATAAAARERPAFGIVSTGKIWEEALQTAVEEFLGCPTTETTSPFVGCETTGLNASELHDLPAHEVRRKMMDATKRLLQRGANTDGGGKTDSSNNNNNKNHLVSRVQAICLGCAGMVGLDSAVRTACVEALGDERGREVYIVDGVKAGVGTLYGLARGGFS
ncbi:DCG1-like protein [Fonsecaea pedrosoi]|nr:DCG1-like protein [Fonsecaea pedrosoi]